MLELFRDSIVDEWHALVQFSPRLIMALIILFIFYLVGRAVRRATHFWLSRSGLDTSKRIYLSRVVGWLPVIFGLLIALSLLRLESLAAGLLAGGGLIAVVLGFAFRQIGENFLAGLILAFNRPFREDDYISCAGFEGTVKNIQLRHSHIRTPDGRDIFIPNARLFTEPLVNYTLDGLRRFEWRVGIDYRDDAGRARQLLCDAAQAVGGVLKAPPVAVQITGFEDNWLQLTAFFWVDVFQSDGEVFIIRSAVADAMRQTLIENGYTLSAEVSSNIDARLSRHETKDDI